jgi:hypothetical protein
MGRISPGDTYGSLTVLREVRKVAADGRRYRAALCRCDCGNQTTPRISSLIAGDARSCGCSRGPPKYQHKRCPVCGTLAMIRRGHRSCSRACGYQLARATRQAPNPSYAAWHHRVAKARGPASGYPCADCGNPAQDWSTAGPSSDDLWARFQPRCRRYHDGATGEGNPRAKLTSVRVRELRARRAEGPDLPAARRRIRHQRHDRLRGRQPQNLGARELSPSSQPASPVTFGSQPRPTPDKPYPPFWSARTAAIRIGSGAPIRSLCPLRSTGSA